MSEMAHERLHGSWQLNIAASSFQPGPAAQIVRYEIAVTGLDLQMSTYRLDAAGQEIQYQYRARFDGQIYPVDAPHADAVAWTPAGPHSYATQIWQDGQLIMTGRLDLSPDGQTIVADYAGVMADGSRIKNYLVVEKLEEGA